MEKVRVFNDLTKRWYWRSLNEISGVQPQFVSTQMITDPDTFLISESFQIGFPALVSIQVTIDSVDSDGVLFSEENDDYSIAINYEQSLDGITWTQQPVIAALHNTISGNTLIIAPGDIYMMVAPVFNWGRVILDIMHNQSGDNYAGSDHPVVTATAHYAMI